MVDRLQYMRFDLMLFDHRLWNQFERLVDFVASVIELEQVVVGLAGLLSQWHRFVEQFSLRSVAEVLTDRQFAELAQHFELQEKAYRHFVVVFVAVDAVVVVGVALQAIVVSEWLLSEHSVVVEVGFVVV
jgi:hypothetical protein